jgi:SAM-dependent methyltransferase
MHKLIPLLLAACTALALPGAAAQPEAYVPKVGQPGKDVIWEPTPDASVERMLRMARTTGSDYVVDLGAGDGRIVIAAARDFGARATGVEYNAELAALARSRILKAGLARRAKIVQGDLFEFDFSSATVVAMYLLPELNLKLRDRLLSMRPGTRVVSHEFDMGDWEPDERATEANERPTASKVELFLWIVPARVAGEWEFRFVGDKLDETRRVRLAQKYQRVQGELGDIRLEGGAISFALSGANEARMRCEGRVRGSRMEGRCATDGGRPGRWTAVRK